MPRPATVHWDKREGAWATSALGEERRTKTGGKYRLKVFNREIPKADRAAAYAWLHAELQKRQAMVVPIGDLTFEQLSEHYLEDAAKDLGAEAYARRVEHILRFADWPRSDDPTRMLLRPCSKISSDDVRRFQTDVLNSGASVSYVVDGLTKSLRRVFNWASSVDPGRYPGLPLERNPVAKVKGPELHRRETREVEPIEVSRFLQWSGRRARKMKGLKQRFSKILTILLRCLRDTGARPKELCAAWWDDWEVRPDGWGVLKLPWWKHKTGRKTRKGREIFFRPSCARRIEWIRALDGRHADHIFVHRRARGAAVAGQGSPWAGEPWVQVDPDAHKVEGNTKSLQKLVFRLRNAAIASGVKLNPKFRMYYNRSAYSTEAQKKGVSQVLIARAMGTSERMLEKNYSDFTTEDILNVAKEIAKRPDQ